MVRTKAALAIAGALVAATLSACGDDKKAEATDPNALVVYNAQHESLTKVWAEAFTKETGIKVVLRSGRDFELANQLKVEGAKSTADVFLTENSPAMAVVETAGLFAAVDAATLAQVPKQYSTNTGKWIGIAARSTVFVYNTSKLTEAQLPKSLMDLAKPEWQGRWGAGASGADFQAIVSAVLETQGEVTTKAWLAAMKTNAKIYSNNIATMTAVNAGEIEGGVIYHYYWYRDQAGPKATSGNTKLHFFGNKDPGAFLSVSGGGVLAAGKHRAQAQQFLKFITGKAGQQALSDSAEFEYSVGSGVAPNKALKPLAELNAPAVDPSKLNSEKVRTMMTEAGLI